VVDSWDSGTEAKRLIEKTIFLAVLARPVPLSRGINILGNEGNERAGG